MRWTLTPAGYPPDGNRDTWRTKRDAIEATAHGEWQWVPCVAVWQQARKDYNWEHVCYVRRGCIMDGCPVKYLVKEMTS